MKERKKERKKRSAKEKGRKLANFVFVFVLTVFFVTRPPALLPPLRPLPPLKSFAGSAKKRTANQVRALTTKFHTSRLEFSSFFFSLLFFKYFLPFFKIFFAIFVFTFLAIFGDFLQIFRFNWPTNNWRHLLISFVLLFSFPLFSFSFSLLFLWIDGRMCNLCV